jgi:hypothetical protein
LAELSALLRSKIALTVNDTVLNKMPFFEGADQNFLMELALSMSMVCYTAHEQVHLYPPHLHVHFQNVHRQVIIEGEVGAEMFFIFRGAVEVLQGGEQIAVLGEQQHFGTYMYIYIYKYIYIYINEILDRRDGDCQSKLFAYGHCEHTLFL